MIYASFELSHYWCRYLFVICYHNNANNMIVQWMITLSIWYKKTLTEQWKCHSMLIQCTKVNKKITHESTNQKSIKFFFPSHTDIRSVNPSEILLHELKHFSFYWQINDINAATIHGYTWTLCVHVCLNVSCTSSVNNFFFVYCMVNSNHTLIDDVILHTTFQLQ